MFFLALSADSAKKGLFSPHMKKNKKFSKAMECFMPEGGKNILFGSTREKYLLFGSEMEKKVC